MYMIRPSWEVPNYDSLRHGAQPSLAATVFPTRSDDFPTALAVITVIIAYDVVYSTAWICTYNFSQKRRNRM